MPSSHRKDSRPGASKDCGCAALVVETERNGIRVTRNGQAVRLQGRLRSGPHRPRRASCFPRVLLAPGSTSTPGQVGGAKVRQAYGRPTAAIAWPLRPGPRYGRRHVSAEGGGFDHSGDCAAAQACGLGMSSRCAPRHWQTAWCVERLKEALSRARAGEAWHRPCGSYLGPGLRPGNYRWAGYPPSWRQRFTSPHVGACPGGARSHEKSFGVSGGVSQKRCARHAAPPICAAS